MDATPSCHSLDEPTRRRFEAARRAGEARAIEEFLLPAEHPLYLGTLRELVLIDMEFAWKAWQPEGADRPAPVESYLKRFPHLDCPELLVELVREDHRLRRGRGDLPNPEDYHPRFPALTLDGPELECAVSAVPR